MEFWFMLHCLLQGIQSSHHAGYLTKVPTGLEQGCQFRAPCNSKLPAIEPQHEEVARPEINCTQRDGGRHGKEAVSSL